MTVSGAAIASVAVIAALLAAMLRRTNPEQATAIGLGAGAVILIATVGQIVPLIGTVRGLLDVGGLGGEYVQILFKALGICLVTQLASDACRDAGESGLAAKADLAGKWILLGMALPLFEKIGSIAVALIERKG